jgi:hypothetical protein
MANLKEHLGGSGQTLWNAPARAAASRIELAPADLDELDELARKISEEVVEDVEVRVRPYRTPVTTETLRIPVP